MILGQNATMTFDDIGRTGNGVELFFVASFFDLYNSGSST
jgi:hypothetical protein